MHRLETLFTLVAAIVLSFACYLAFSASWASKPVRDAMALAPRGSHTDTPPIPSYAVASLPPLRPGGELNFGLAHDNRALLSGWSAPDDGGVWSVSKDASIGFIVQCAPAECPAHDPILLFSGLFYVFPGHFSQTIEAWVENTKIDGARLSTPDPGTEFVIELKGRALRDGVPIILSLHLPDAILPEDNPNDERELALQISSLRLDPSP